LEPEPPAEIAPDQSNTVDEEVQEEIAQQDPDQPISEEVPEEDRSNDAEEVEVNEWEED